jgi:SAM-dependent methyltransferase
MPSSLPRRVVRRVLPPPSSWHLTVPPYWALLERAWEARVRRAPRMSPEAHAAAVADPDRRGAAIEQVAGCPLCGKRELQPLLHPVRKRWDYHVVRCCGCGLLYRHPAIQPERLGELYSSGRYGRFLEGHYGKRRRRRYTVAMAGFGALFEHGDGRRLLDVGCGTGLFLDLAYERGFDCYGVDLAESAVARARQKPFGAHIHYGTPGEVPEIAAGGFDVITLWSVLAHLARPVEDIRQLRELLAPGGVLVLLTVNAGSLKLRRQLEDWVGFTPNHLQFFAPDTLHELFRRAGFAAVVMPPWYGDRKLNHPLWARRLLRHAIRRGNRGDMLRAAAFADADGPARWNVRAAAAALSAAGR